MNQPHWRAYYYDINPNDPDSSDQIVRNIDLHHLSLNHLIQGSGKHHSLGDFAIEGTSVDNQV
jgi:hypothetical protein